MADLYNVGNAKFDILQSNIITNTTANATAWKIPADEITAITAFQTIWTPAYAKVKNKNTASAADRVACKTAKDKFTVALRLFGNRWVVNNPNVPLDGVKLCGLRRRATTRIPHKDVPFTQPEIKVQEGGGTSLLLQSNDINNPKAGHSNKPEDAMTLEIFICVGDVVPGDRTMFTRKEYTTAGIKKLDFPEDQADMNVSITARWFNKNGMGPLCDTIHIRVPKIVR